MGKKNEIEIACKCERGDKDSYKWNYGIACYEGERVEIQRFFKEGGENGWIEIDQQEYDNYYRGKEDSE